MSSTEVWRYLSALQPTTKRSQVEYTPKGQARQTYTVENGHIYNSKGTEVYPGKTVHKNMVLANYAVQEGLAVVVKHPTSGEKYVVDNNQQITSVRTGDIMKWGEENGDRRKILAQAEKEFRERIIATKERGSALNEQMLDQLQLIGLDLHYEDEMTQYLKEHGNKVIQESIGGFIDKYSLPKGELPTLSKALLSRFGNKTAYGDVVNTAEYEYTVNYKGAGEFDIIEYHRINNTIHEQYDRKRGQIPNAINQLSRGNEITEGEYNSDNYNASEGEADGYYAGLDQETSQGEPQQTQSNVSGQENQRGSTRLIKTGADGTVYPRVIEAPDIMPITTPEGEVRGFATPEGSLYFDRTVMSPEHTVHEYTHLWDRVVAKDNPELWHRGVALMKQISLWKDIENDENYGKKWKALKGMNSKKLESLIASEVHSRLTGVNGELILDRLSKEKGQKGIIGKLKQCLLDFWKDNDGNCQLYSDYSKHHATS